MQYLNLTLFADGDGETSAAVGEENTQTTAPDGVNAGEAFHENESENRTDNAGVSADEIRQTERAARIYALWERESEILKNEYPEFDLKNEAKNPKFVSLLRAGANLREAYEVTHRDSLLPERVKNAIYREVTRIVDEIEERKSRPDENGITDTSNPITKRSVASMSKSEREALERRALHGEHIIL